jgi:hypothetical protein
VSRVFKLIWIVLYLFIIVLDIKLNNLEFNKKKSKIKKTKELIVDAQTVGWGILLFIMIGLTLVNMTTPSKEK